MQFTHKAAKRLAISRTLALATSLAVLAACESQQGDHLGPGDEALLFPFTRVAIETPPAEVEVNDLVQLAAVGLTATGKQIPVGVKWTASGGTIDAQGTFSAGAKGSYTVYATRRGGKSPEDSTAIRVSPSTLEYVKVSPGSAVLAPATRQVFTATAHLKDGSTVPLASVKWSATGGVIDSAGVYRAPKEPGSYRVTAKSVKGIADTAVVTVSDTDAGATVRSIVLTPARVSMEPTATQAFTASALTSDDEVAPVEVMYRATGGTITADGLFRASETPGTYHVTATAAGGKADTSVVTITSEEPTVQRVILRPSTASLEMGDTQQFSATAEMSDGSTVPAPVTYRVTGGTVTGDGLYTAGTTAGSYRVIATASNGEADTSAVTITAAGATLTEVVLTPTSVSLAAGARQQFSATGKMSDGTTTPVPVVYAATGGSITSDGLYSAGQTNGAFRVIASHQGGTLADTSAVTITVTSTTGQPARMADSLVESMGINAHINYGNYASVWGSFLRSRILELGVRHIRGVGAGSVNDGTLARARDLYQTAGIKFGKGCKHKDGNFTDASHCIPYLNDVGTSFISFVGGENEMDTGDADYVRHWVEWQTAIYRAYKAHPVWKNYPVLMSSISQSNAQARLGSHPDILDIGDMHSYPGGNMPSIVSNDWLPATRAVVGPNKPIWATETGYHNSLSWTGGNKPISERGSGKYVSRLWFEYWNRGIDRTYIYELWDQGTTADREDHFGLVRHDGSPKPQFTATKHIIALLKDPGPAFATGRLDYALSSTLSTTHRTLLQKRDGRFYLVLWQEISVWNRETKTDVVNQDDQVTLTLARPASAIRVYQPLKGASPVQTGSGTSMALSVPDEVIVVEITP